LPKEPFALFVREESQQAQNSFATWREDSLLYPHKGLAFSRQRNDKPLAWLVSPMSLA
jgi:hypothetical protein